MNNSDPVLFYIAAELPESRAGLGSFELLMAERRQSGRLAHVSLMRTTSL
jgi:hypothetical protein